MDATFWAIVALVIFLGIVVYMKVPGMIVEVARRARRARSATNSTRPGACARKPSSCWPNTSASARKPRRKRPTSSPPPSARPTMLVEDAQKKTEEYVARRTALAEQKIGQAERDAVNEVRASAVDIAVEAARKLLGRQGRRQDQRRSVQDLAAGGEGQAELSRRSRMSLKSRLGNQAAFLLCRICRISHRALFEASRQPRLDMKVASAMPRRLIGFGHLRLAEPERREGEAVQPREAPCIARSRRGGARWRSPYALRSRSGRGPGRSPPSCGRASPWRRSRRRRSTASAGRP